MVLSHQFIGELLTNSQSSILLAFSEHAVIPDEMYFATFGSATLQKTLASNATFVHFTGNEPHPDYLNINQIKQANSCDLVFFVRKVERTNVDVREYCDKIRNDVDKTLGIS
jgi:hypothetical protein